MRLRLKNRVAYLSPPNRYILVVQRSEIEAVLSSRGLLVRVRGEGVGCFQTV